jgi:tRNA(adenine34) deaminase
VRKVATESTFPPAATFNQPAREIARIMARPSVSPKGLGSAIRMVQYLINRGGKDLSATRKRELEKAKHLLQERRDEEVERKKNNKARPQRKSRQRNIRRSKST